MLKISYAGEERLMSVSDLGALPGQVADVSERFPGRQGRAVPLKEVLSLAAAPTGGDLVLISSDGSFQIPLVSTEVDAALLLYQLEGSPLPRDQGGPLRLLVHGPEKCRRHGEDPCANVKDLGEIRVLSA